LIKLDIVNAVLAKLEGAGVSRVQFFGDLAAADLAMLVRCALAGCPAIISSVEAKS
jgi:hypothetical protein